MAGKRERGDMTSTAGSAADGNATGGGEVVDYYSLLGVAMGANAAEIKVIPCGAIEFACHVIGRAAVCNDCYGSNRAASACSVVTLSVQKTT